MSNFQRSAVVDVQGWMKRADELVKLIESLVVFNFPNMMTNSTVNPQDNEEAARGVVELGYRDVRHFCESFPAKFQVNQQLGIIALQRDSKKTNQPDTAMSRSNMQPVHQQFNRTTTAFQLRDAIEKAVAWNRPTLGMSKNVNPDDNSFLVDTAAELGYRSIRDFCSSYPQWFNIHPQTGVITSRPRTQKPFAALEGHDIYLDPVTGAWLKNRKPANKAAMNDQTLGFEATNATVEVPREAKPLNMEEKIHFKLTHGGVTRRFALSRGEEDLLAALKARVLKITGTPASLFWKDEDSLIILENEEDMNAAIDFAETQNKLACVTLETGVDKKDEKKEEEEKKTEAKVVSAEESQAAFNGFAFMCDACDCYLAPSNGGRFKCTLCDNYDLCAACLAKGAHDNHAFVRLLNGETEVPLSNELGGVLSMQTRDSPRCTPMFVAKSPGMKGADKIFIDVINSVGTHVGKKMYDTAEWIKKEAEKMGQRREEAEIAEQKMVEEIIRREREEEEKKWRRRREDKQRQEQMEMEKEMAKKEFENAADLKAKLLQLEKDKKLAEQMWREEKKQWKGTRKQFKREEKHLRKAEKFQARLHKDADKPKEEVKPEEKKDEKMETAPAPVLDKYYELSTSSDDSDMEMLDKPAMEKHDSIVSDLVILEDQKAQPAAAAAAPAAPDQEVAALTQQITELSHQEQPKDAAAAERAAQEQRFAEALSQHQQAWRGVSAEELLLQQQEMQQQAQAHAQYKQQQQQQQSSIPKPAAEEPQRQQSIYPELPESERRPFSMHWDRDARQRGGFGGFERDTRHRGFEGGDREELDRQAAVSRAEREERWRTEHEQSPRHVYQAEEAMEDVSYRYGGRRPENRGSYRDHPDRELRDRIRAERAARAAEASKRKQERVTDQSELRAKAQKLPVLMEMAILAKLENATPQTMETTLSENCEALNMNLYRRERHDNVFSDDKRVDNELIQLVANNLLHRLRSMQRIVRNSSPDNRARMISNRIHELRNDQTPIDDDDKFNYEGKAAQLSTILLSAQCSQRSPFGFPPMPPFANIGQGLNALIDQSGLSNYLSGFMVPPPHAFGAPIPAPAPPTTAAAPATAPAAPAAPAAAASAPAEEKPDMSTMTNDQQRVLRQLFESGMFDDYDKMVKVCRRASDIHEAIDMMLQE